MRFISFFLNCVKLKTKLTPASKGKWMQKMIENDNYNGNLDSIFCYRPIKNMNSYSGPGRTTVPSFYSKDSIRVRSLQSTLGKRDAADIKNDSLPNDAFIPLQVPVKSKNCQSSSLTALIEKPNESKYVRDEFQYLDIDEEPKFHIETPQPDDEILIGSTEDEDICNEHSSSFVTAGDILDTIRGFEESGTKTIKFKSDSSSVRTSSSKLRLMPAEEDGTLMEDLPEFCLTSDITAAGIEDFLVVKDDSEEMIHVRVASTASLQGLVRMDITRYENPVSHTEEKAQDKQATNNEDLFDDGEIALRYGRDATSARISRAPSTGNLIVQCRQPGSAEWVVAGEIVTSSGKYSAVSSPDRSGNGDKESSTIRAVDSEDSADQGNFDCTWKDVGKDDDFSLQSRLLDGTATQSHNRSLHISRGYFRREDNCCGRCPHCHLL